MKRDSLRVLALLQLPPPIHGAALRNKDFVESEIIKGSCDLDTIPIQTAKSLEDIGGVSFTKVMDTFFLCAKLVYKLIFTRPDMAYITLSAKGFAFYKDSFLICLCLMFKVPVVCHMRNRGLGDTIRSSSFSNIFKRILSKCNYISMSKNLSEDVSLVCKKTFIISNCLTTQPKELTDEVIAGRLNKQKVIYLSNISESKGSLTFLRAIASMAKIDPEYFQKLEINVYGPFSSNEEKFKFVTELESYNFSNVYIKGSIYGEDKFNELMSSSVMIFPTNYDKECFPGVIMEAFMCGIPVVARATAAIPEIIKSGVDGYVLEDDPQEYAIKVLDILKNDYVSYARSANESYRKTMTHEAVHPQLINCFRKVIGNNDSK